MTVALFWDVDGTLLTTARAGGFSLEDALERVSGVRADLQGMATAGLTDYLIAETALRAVGHPGDEATVGEFLRVHGEQLPDYLDRREGHVLPGVREVLEDLSGRDGLVNLLLTGNIDAGRRAALEPTQEAAMQMNVKPIPTLEPRINAIRSLTAQIVNREILPNERTLWAGCREGGGSPG